MADAHRFPHLAVPFAIVGAAAGWLSAGLVHHPVVLTSGSEVRLVMAGVAAGLGLSAGALIRRWCAGKRYHWEVDAPDPGERLPSDSWWRHGPVILGAGLVAGGLFAVLTDYCTVEIGMLGGLACTLPFLPVCAAVLSAARRAQRARLGSLVAGSDRRAVWGILATALLIVTLEGLPDWPAPRGRPLFGPEPVLALLVAAVLCIAGVLAADWLALRRARRILAQDLARQELDAPSLSDESVARMDLGLGDGVLAQVSRTGPVYRGRDRTLALVQGDPDQALAALRRSLRRGAIGLAIATTVCAAHAAATTDAALARYDEIRCDAGDGESCASAAQIELNSTVFSTFDPSKALSFFERGCSRGDGSSCMSLAWLYRGNQGIDRDAGMVAIMEYRAAQRGLCPEGTRLVNGTENVCVDPSDPRH